MKLVQNHGSAIKKEVDLKPEEDQQKTSYCYECFFFARKQSHCTHYAVIILFMFQIQKSTLTNTFYFIYVKF